MADYNAQSRRIRSKSVPNILDKTEGEDDIKKQPLKTPPPLKIDLIALKNEILTDGVQVSAMAGTCIAIAIYV